MRLLRSLEKRLVVERTELAVVPLVHDLLSDWEEGLSHDRPTPDPLDFVVRLVRSGFCFTTGSKAFAYLDRCHWKGSLPDEGRLLRILMPWYVPGQSECSTARDTPDVPVSHDKGVAEPFAQIESLRAHVPGHPPSVLTESEPEPAPLTRPARGVSLRRVHSPAAQAAVTVSHVSALRRGLGEGQKTSGPRSGV